MAMSRFSRSTPEKVRAAAGDCANMRKLPEHYRRMFTHLSVGGDVEDGDLTEGLVLAMQCCVTAAGQSMARRARAEGVRSLWEWHMDITGAPATVITYPPLKPSREKVPNLRQPEAVEAWLAS